MSQSLSRSEIDTLVPLLYVRGQVVRAEPISYMIDFKYYGFNSNNKLVRLTESEVYPNAKRFKRNFAKRIRSTKDRSGL